MRDEPVFVDYSGDESGKCECEEAGRLFLHRQHLPSEMRVEMPQPAHHSHLCLFQALPGTATAWGQPRIPTTHDSISLIKKKNPKIDIFPHGCNTTVSQSWFSRCALVRGTGQSRRAGAELLVCCFFFVLRFKTVNIAVEASCYHFTSGTEPNTEENTRVASKLAMFSISE